VAVLVALAAGLGSAEAIVRSLGRTDVDGNFFFLGRRLPPHRLPVRLVQDSVEEVRTRQDELHVVYDPDLGWTYRPRNGSADSGHCSNDAGIRVPRLPFTYSRRPEPGVLRIALFGDSFTYGSEQSFFGSYGAQLESELRSRGIDAEVLNFGVAGYGTDQALLRWRKQGRERAAQVVILGFVAEDAWRNVNLIPALLFLRGRQPWSKPRFLEKGGELTLVNRPALPPEGVTAILEHFESWELAPHEYFYGHGYRARSPLLASRLAGLVVLARDRLVAQRRPETTPFHPSSEPGRLALAIVSRFEREVHDAGARFIVVHLPTRHHLPKGGRLIYHELLAELSRRHTVLDPMDAFRELVAEHGAKRVYMPGTHYSRLGNRVVAMAVADLLAPPDEP
jgi:hypothetical protein